MGSSLSPRRLGQHFLPFHPSRRTPAIHLARDIFEGIGGKGTLAAGKFFLASDYDGTAKAVIYDVASGNLYYSKDGGGLGQNFGRIGNGAELDNQDFLIA